MLTATGRRHEELLARWSLPVFQILEAIRNSFNFLVKRAHDCGMAPQPHFDWRGPLVKLGQESGLDPLKSLGRPFLRPPEAFLKPHLHLAEAFLKPFLDLAEAFQDPLLVFICQHVAIIQVCRG